MAAQQVRTAKGDGPPLLAGQSLRRAHAHGGQKERSGSMHASHSSPSANSAAAELAAEAAASRLSTGKQAARGSVSVSLINPGSRRKLKTEGFPPTRQMSGGWSATESSSFRLLKGPDYNINREKAPSASSLYTPISVDAFRSEQKISHVAERLRYTPDTAALINRAVKRSRGKKMLKGLPLVVIVTWQMPMVCLYMISFSFSQIADKHQLISTDSTRHQIRFGARFVFSLLVANCREG